MFRALVLAALTAGLTTVTPASADPCPCPAGMVYVPSPKQCFTTPCPQYDCVSLSALDDGSR